jgi:peptidoglycan hydrolase CwlO-like protein
MDSTTIKNAINSKPYYIYIIGIVIVIAFIFIGYYFGTYNPQSKIVTDLVDTQLKIDKQKYDNDIKEKNSKNKELQDKLIKTQAQVLASQTEITKLKGDLDRVKPPANVEETRSRLLSRGYPTF